MSEIRDLTPIFIDIETDVVPEKLFKDLYPANAVNKLLCVGHACRDEEPMAADTSRGWRPNFLVNPHLPRQDRQKTCLVGHNIIKFDIPVLERLLKVDLSAYPVFDTLIMAKLVYPGLPSYSLKNLANQLRLKNRKTEMPSDTGNIDELMKYCKQDVEVTRDLFNHLADYFVEGHNRVPMRVLNLEQYIAKLAARTAINGFPFDAMAANQLVKDCTSQMYYLEKAVQAFLPRIPLPASKIPKVPAKQFKKDGTPSVAIQNYAKKIGYAIVKDVSTSTSQWAITNGTNITLPLKKPLVATEQLNLNNINGVKQALLDAGWEPTLWNYQRDSKGKIKRPLVRTSPKLYDENKELCPNLSKVNAAWAKDIPQFLTLRNRLGVLGGWLSNARLNHDGKLTPDADTLGAATARYTHKIIANVPRVSSSYGREMRGCFVPSNGKAMVGWDASALEACMEAHYTYPYDGGIYANSLLEHDIHENNMINLGLKDRDEAKKVKYMLTYGAGPSKLQSSLGYCIDRCEQIHRGFWNTNSALHKVKEASMMSGVLTCLDGRKIAPPSAHAAMNYLFQSAGAITMKYASVIADKMIQKAGIKGANCLIRYHDEEQWECWEEDADALGAIGVESIKRAGEYLKLRIELSGAYKVGKSWAETH